MPVDHIAQHWWRSPHNVSITNADVADDAAIAESKIDLSSPAHVHPGGPGGEAFPVGSVFTSVVSTNPATLLGYGTWAAFGAGRVLVGLDWTDADFNVAREVGGAKTHTLLTTELPAHTHVQDAHTHTQNSHNHIQDAHTHTQNSHNHTQDAHTHIQDAHTHTQNAHSHAVTSVGSAATGATTNLTGASDTSSTTATAANATAVNQNATATNQNATATNQVATAVNQNSTPTNQATTAANQNTTATNQLSGGGGAHNNLQPYIVVYFWERTA